MTLSLEATTMKNDKNYRFAETATTKYVSKKVDSLMLDGTSQREIAMAAGWSQPAMISMIKRGEIKPPMEKIPALARAIKADPAHLMRLVLNDHHPELAEALAAAFGTTLSENEIAVIKYFRELTSNQDPPLDDALRDGLGAALLGPVHA